LKAFWLPLSAPGAHDQADRDARDHAVSVGASGRGTVSDRFFLPVGDCKPMVI
jgi:hypothetical protein